MKNIVLGIIGIGITLYTLLIGLQILSTQTQKNELEKQVSRIVKNTLEAEYGGGDETLAEQMLIQEITSCVSAKSGRVEVDVKAIDLQKGILSVKVTKWVEMLNGREKKLVVEKTAIVERAYVDIDRDVFDNGLGRAGNNSGRHL